MYFIWKLHVWVPFKLLSSPTHTLIPTVFPLLEMVLVRFFCDDLQLLRLIFLYLRNRFESSSFEGFFKGLGTRKSHKEQGQVSRG